MALAAEENPWTVELGKEGIIQEGAGGLGGLVLQHWQNPPSKEDDKKLKELVGGQQGSSGRLLGTKCAHHP